VVSVKNPDVKTTDVKNPDVKTTDAKNATSLVKNPDVVKTTDAKNPDVIPTTVFVKTPNVVSERFAFATKLTTVSKTVGPSHGFKLS
jgi:hypothetical protein